MTEEMKEQINKIKKPIIYNNDGTISIKGVDYGKSDKTEK